MREGVVLVNIKWRFRCALIALAVVLVGLGSAYFVVRLQVLANPSRALGGDWRKGVAETVFLQYTAARDNRLGALVGEYVYKFDTNRVALSRLDDTDVLLLRNFFFAVRGYQFVRPDLYDYFSQFAWYHPRAAVSGDMASLSLREQQILSAILQIPMSNSTSVTAVPRKTILPETLLGAIPVKSTAFIYWNASDLPFDRRLVELGKMASPYITDNSIRQVADLFTAIGSTPADLREAAFFVLNPAHSDAPLAFNSVLRLRKMSDHELIRSIGKEPATGHYRGRTYWLFNGSVPLAHWDDMFLVATSENSLRQIVDTLEGAPNITTSAMDAAWIRKENMSGVLASFSSDVASSLQFGLVEVHPKRLRFSLVEKDRTFSLDAQVWTGSPPPGGDKRHSALLVPDFMIAESGIIPFPDSWASILLRAAKTRNINYTLANGIGTLRAEWVVP